MNIQTKYYCFSSIIDLMDRFEAQLDVNLKDHCAQVETDRMADKIKKECAPLFESLKQWLEQKSEGNWEEQLKLSLVKLPIRSALNIMTSLYSLIGFIFYTAVHPLKGTTHLVKAAIILMNELTKPEVWSKIGTGSVGMIIGQSLMMGSSFSLIGLVLAGALSVGGTSVDAFLSALKCEKGNEIEEIKEKLGAYLQNLPEAALTGFFSGLLIGGIRRITSQKITTVAKHAFEKVPNYGAPHLDWNNEVIRWECGVVPLKKYMDIANSDPRITHFFISKCSLTLEHGVFFQGEAVFFTGTPGLLPESWMGDTYWKI